jgi:hypothetical protein
LWFVADVQCFDVNLTAMPFVCLYFFFNVAFQLKVGFFNCIVDIIILMIAINTWGFAIFGLSEFPAWAGAKSINGTLAAAYNGTTGTQFDWFVTSTALP